MSKRRNNLIALYETQSLTRKMLTHCIRFDPSLNKIFQFNTSEIRTFFNISTKKASHIYKSIQQAHFYKDINNQPYQILTIYDIHYPRQLKMIPDPPLVLYAIGNVSLLADSYYISVIGTRKPSSDAFLKLQQIVTPLIKLDWVIVSGFAYGIDSMAHQLTIQHQGKTIAVLGGGFHHIYPRTNMQLFHDIEKFGLVLSEYPPNIAPKRYHFPERNRIISGLSQATLVIEAMERSGTLITVDQALEQGREVYVVPGSPLIPQTRGCHKLIQDGAKLVISANDIMEDWLD